MYLTVLYFIITVVLVCCGYMLGPTRSRLSNHSFSEHLHLPYVISNVVLLHFSCSAVPVSQQCEHMFLSTLKGFFVSLQSYIHSSCTVSNRDNFTFCIFMHNYGVICAKGQ